MTKGSESQREWVTTSDEDVIGLSEQKKSLIMSEYASDMLTPSNLEEMDWSHVKVGLEYTYDYVWKTPARVIKEKRIRQLKKIDGDKYFFDMYNNGRLSSMKMMFRNGREHIKWLSDKYDPTDKGCSIFVEGECEYESGKNEFKKVTKYSDGIWHTNTYMNGNLRFVKQAIYDKNGIKLFNRSDRLNSEGQIDLIVFDVLTSKKQ